jgi:hypothetical protein
MGLEVLLANGRVWIFCRHLFGTLVSFCSFVIQTFVLTKERFWIAFANRLLVAE